MDPLEEAVVCRKTLVLFLQQVDISMSIEIGGEAWLSTELGEQIWAKQNYTRESNGGCGCW